MITFGTGEASDGAGAVALDAQTLGGKGAGLVAMAAAGLATPPGFVLSTTWCRTFATDGWTPGLDEAVTEGIQRLEVATGKRLGDPERPLLVSVRSGAPLSMPGMLDSILDVGMTDAVESALTDATGDALFAIDTHRRFLDSYESVVGTEAPQDPVDQLHGAIVAVFDSHRGARARTFQRRHGTDDLQLTAVVVQQMVFGNFGERSGTGVAHSRDPITGEHRLTGEFLPRAQGADVVSGTHQTRPLEAMREHFEDVYIDLGVAVGTLETRYGGAVEVEFTVERGRLYLLQVRPMASTPASEEPSTAACDAADPPLVTGIAASRGRATGVLCTEIDEALARADAGETVVLVRPETTPADVDALAVSAALVTTRGGMASHAAVVARAWGIPAVVGAADIGWAPDGITVGTRTVPVGTEVTVDGTLGSLAIAAPPA